MSDIESEKGISTQLFENSVRWQVDNSLRLQLNRITDESSLSNVTDTEIYRKRYSILMKIAELKGIKEEDVIKEEVERANKLEEKFCGIYQKEQDVLKSGEGDREAHLKTIKEYDDMGIIENWLPPFSNIRISLHERREQIKNQNIGTDDALNYALGKAYMSEAGLVEAKATEIYNKAESTGHIELKNKAALLKHKSEIMSSAGFGLSITKKTALDTLSTDSGELITIAKLLRENNRKRIITDTSARVRDLMISEAVLHKPLVAK